MASITNSLFPISPATNRTQQFTTAGRKRRPIDPPGEEACNGKCYTSSTSQLLSLKGAQFGQPPNKRTRTVDSSLEMLSLGAADPPGYFCYQSSTNSHNRIASNDVHINQLVDFQPRPPAAGAKSNDTTSTASTTTTNNKRPYTNGTAQVPNPLSNKRMQQCRRMEQSSSGITDTGNSDMSLEGSDMYSDDESLGSSSSSGSVSESSIRNSMYQVVFGRMKGSSAGGSGATYDIVDAKIEDLIRRSRMEAVLKSTREKEKKDPPKEEAEDSIKSMDIG